jgi:lysozyme
MLDVETTGGLSTEAFCDSLHLFLRMLEQTYRQKPLVYTFRNFYNKHLLGKLDDYQLMIAMYADDAPVLADERDYIIWQYSSRGRISGVSTDVDKSRFMRGHSLRELRFRR